jgi:uncharacterized protein (DUF486 family)
MTRNLIVYYNTATVVSQGQHLWPVNPKLWPTYLMLGIAVLSTVLAGTVLLAYTWGTKTANRWNTARFALSLTTIAVMVISWGVAAAGMQSTSDYNGIGTQSLWSATCDATQEQIQLFGHTVNFGQFCLEQVSSAGIGLTKQWSVVCSGIGIALEGLTGISYLYVFLRMRHKRTMKNFVQAQTFNSPLPSPLPSPYFDNKFPRSSDSSPIAEYDMKNALRSPPIRSPPLRSPYFDGQTPRASESSSKGDYGMPKALQSPPIRF